LKLGIGTWKIQRGVGGHKNLEKIEIDSGSISIKNNNKDTIIKN